ncbi:MAG TPA: hypothetical protein VMC84_00100 [Methanocella sp.]|uniref:hypothetical protein n=1 Tax=Methanocella sp. TaxID=2052833 RepID=UPI002B8406E5|nr:hypothetical protein [Methanocella sp.]HTY89556.1 hypothetical protein [Methanocella sp.]
MNRIILNVVDKKTDFARRVVIETSMPLQSCDFITIGEDTMFDRDTDFFTFGFDVDTGSRQLAIVTGEFLPRPAVELIDEIKKSLEGRYEVIEDKDEQLWLREKVP